ncbi:MAG: ATP-binding protein [Pseudomonadota bacterium]
MIVDYLRTSYAFVIPPVLGFFVLIFLCLLSFLRGPRRSTNILFAGMCLMGALINLDVALVSILPDKTLALKLDRMIYVVFVFSPPIYIQFVHAFLRLNNRRWLEMGAYLMSLSFLFFVFSDRFISGFHEYPFGTIAKAGPVFHVFSVLSSFTVFYCLFMLLAGMKATQDNQRKNRIKYILGGMGMSALLVAFNILPVIGFNIYPMGNFSFIPAVFLAFGVLKYDLLDIGVLIRKGTAYFILTAVLTIIYVAIIALFNTLFWQAGQKHTLILPVFLALLMILLFDPIRKKVQAFIDRLFFRGRYDYHQLLKEISGEMSSLLKLDQIKTFLLESINAALHVTQVCLLVYDDGQGCFQNCSNQDESAAGKCNILTDRAHPVVAYLEACKGPLNKSVIERKSIRFNYKQDILQVFDEMQIVLLVPLISKNRLIGMIGLGQKKSGQLFVQEDMELLSTIANQSVTAIDNARMYEALEKMNLELEKKVEQRTADLCEALAEKERTQKQLIQSESLAAIGQLVAGTAHELNNPLASASSLIQTSVESVRQWDTTEKARSDVEDDLLFSLKELRRAGAIVKSLLGLSRQTQTYVEPVRINAALDDALRVLYNQYKYLKVAVDKEYDDSLPDVRGNFANLGQVFINVIKNAVQALPEGKGSVTLKTRYQKDTDCVIVEISDTGSGISGAHLKDIFKPFYTTKEVGQGTGLGLYISHEIVKRHGGAIHVRSEMDSGTVVTIELPCQRRES